MLRERVTITVEPELLAAVDTLVDKSRIRNRSHAIEHVLKEGLGLHQLTQAFIFADEELHEGLLEQLLGLFAETNIRQLYLALPAASVTLAQYLEGIISEFKVEPAFRTQVVPSDFGSGGALVLQKAELEQPFLLAWLSNDTALPGSLLPAFVFHRQHGATLTQLLVSADAASYRSCRLAIAQPELVLQVPAGLVSLEEDVFPELIKHAKVRGYAIPRP